MRSGPGRTTSTDLGRSRRRGERGKGSEGRSSGSFSRYVMYLSFYVIHVSMQWCMNSYHDWTLHESLEMFLLQLGFPSGSSWAIDQMQKIEALSYTQGLHLTSPLPYSSCGVRRATVCAAANRGPTRPRRRPDSTRPRRGPPAPLQRCRRRPCRGSSSTRWSSRRSAPYARLSISTRV